MNHKKILLILFIILVGTFLIACSSGSSKDSSNSDTIDTGTEDGTDPDPDPTPGPNPEPTHVIGWTESTPSPFDTSSHTLTHIEQPGSRIFYLSTDGDDSTAEIYFWDGTNIVDSSGSTTGSDNVSYGTDPMNPSGPIKPYARWPYVAPRAYPGADIGTPWPGAGENAPGSNNPETRYGYPDWWLFKRGDTFDLNDDYETFVLESAEALPENGIKYVSLAVSGGRSETERQIVGAYGDLSDLRPKFIFPPDRTFVSRFNEPDPKHILYLSLHFDGNTEPRGGSGFFFLGQTSDAVDIVIEDCWVDGTRSNIAIKSSGQFTIRRTLVTNSWTDDTEDASGFFYDGELDNGQRNGMLRVEQSIFMRNGFSGGNPKELPWPPTTIDRYDIRSRNLYISGETNNMTSGFFDTISMVGASGDQFRLGLQLERNFFYQGYVNMGAHGGYPDSDGPTGGVLDNVFQRFVGGGAAHGGNGFRLTSGSAQVEIARNIITTAQYDPENFAFGLHALDWMCYSHIYHYATRNNSIHDNIFDSGNEDAAIQLADGINDSDPWCVSNGIDIGWEYPGVTGNTVDNNILISTGNTASVNDPHPSALGTTNDTTFSGNSVYTSRAAAASEQDWQDPDRTLKTYLESIGVSVTSDDGFIEFYNQAILQRKGYWRPEYTARAVVNHVREGFGMDHLEDEE